MERGLRESKAAPRRTQVVREPRTVRRRIVITQRMRPRFTLVAALVAALALAAVVAGCGSSEGGDTTHPNYEKALAGAPAPLATLYGEADQLLPGGKDAFEKRVGGLGYPVVTNVWASWCGPCRLEFHVFQQVAARMGKKVAFVGVNSEDEEAHAADFLSNHQVPYPSYYDPHDEVESSLKLEGLPATAFYARDGKLAFTKIGPYLYPPELEADIKKYALGVS
jgi:cytochrome c biogenesis protein CcmG, thiol:disulfide interchange protein DsbE